MNRPRLLTLAAAAVCTVTAFAAPKYVTIEAPGTLDSVLTAENAATAKHLVVKGRIDARDLCDLGSAIKVAGRVRTLDLGNLRIMSDGNRPAMIDSVFNGCTSLTDIVMPDSLSSFLFNGTFSGCTSLKTVTYGTVDYIASQAFKDLPSLEKITVKGRLAHVDAFVCVNLPQLKEIVFDGPVMSTGGNTLAENCPQLKRVVFNDIVVNHFFFNVEGCPALTECEARAYVGYPKGSLVKGRSIIEGGAEVADRIYNMMAREMSESKTYQYFNYAGSLYDVACTYSLGGDKYNAYRFLELALKMNPASMDYSHMLEDTDLKLLHGEARFDSIAQQVREATDFPYVLKKANAYATCSDTTGRKFTYAAPTDSDLVRTRKFFNLDSIAGNGDEVSRIKNVLYWLHDAIEHDGGSGIPSCPRTAIDMYEACAGKRGLNCRGMAIMLSEMYMALGMPARFVTCQPRAYDTDNDCHVICTVWSRQLGKWLWVDPTFAAYVCDDHGNMLSIAEVRERMRADLPMSINEDANWNHRSNETTEHYLGYYMAKNLYYLSTYLESGVNTENGEHTYITLQPEGTAPIGGEKTTDDAWFWQAPSECSADK